MIDHSEGRPCRSVAKVDRITNHTHTAASHRPREMILHLQAQMPAHVFSRGPCCSIFAVISSFFSVSSCQGRPGAWVLDTYTPCCIICRFLTIKHIISPFLDRPDGLDQCPVIFLGDTVWCRLGFDEVLFAQLVFPSLHLLCQRCFDLY